MKNRIIYILLLLIFSLSSCLDDKGNYDYESVNEVIIELEKTYAVRKIDTTVVIKPIIKQTDLPDISNLSFTWRLSTSNQIAGDIVSTADSVEIKIDPEDPKFLYNHYLRLYIHDSVTGADYFFPVHLKVIKPYEGCWMVLHTKENQTMLGAIEYIGDKIDVIEDAYFKERGERIKGKASSLAAVSYFVGGKEFGGYQPLCLFYCFTDDPDESGILKPDKKFERLDSMGTVSEFVYPAHLSDFDCTNVIACESGGRNGICISNGYLFQRSMYNTKMYKVNPLEGLNNMNITHGAVVGWTSLVFDSNNNCFIHFYNYGNAYGSASIFDIANENKLNMETIRKDPNNVPGINLDNIGSDQKMVYLGSGYWYGPSMIAAASRISAYALTVSQTVNKCYFYEFHGNALYTVREDDFPFPFYTELVKPEGLTVNTPITSSLAYNRILFYAVDNKVYRLDIGASGGISTLIYTHDDPTSIAVKLEMARKDGSPHSSGSYDVLYENYGHNLNRSLGIIFDKADGNSEVVILNLNTAGAVDVNGTYPSVQVHSGFGKIQDIKFI